VDNLIEVAFDIVVSHDAGYRRALLALPSETITELPTVPGLAVGSQQFSLRCPEYMDNSPGVRAGFDNWQ
jgi:hypothetical protein